MSITPDEFAERLSRVSKRDFLKALRRVSTFHAAEMETLSKNIASTRLNARTGNLVRSIGARVRKRADGMEIELRAGGGQKRVKYARTHEFGAMKSNAIRPKKGKFLAVPVHEELFTGVGVNRYASPRDVPEELFFHRNDEGKAMLLSEATNEVWYVLMKRVEIPPRPFMKPALDETEKNLIPEVSLLLRGALNV
tara:strand:+ start:2206 stop:2790 length:585 start_codon:yes stop_codon:yes gene_type:complete